MKSIRHLLWAGATALLCASCATTAQTSLAPSGKATPHAEVKAEFLTAPELRSLARAADRYPGLNDRLRAVWPQVAYTPGQSQPQSAILVAAAGWVTKEIVNYIGTYLEAEAARHSAQFGATVANPDWWNPADTEPLFTAIRLTRAVPGDLVAPANFDLIVLIKPVIGTAKVGNSRAISGYELIPVYLLETKPKAEVFGKELGGSIAIHINNTWVSNEGEPSDRIAVDYTLSVDRYTIGKPLLFADESGAPTAISPYFAMPERPATITAEIEFTETDPSQLVTLLRKLGKAIAGQADNASTSVKAKIAQ